MEKSVKQEYLDYEVVEQSQGPKDAPKPLGRHHVQDQLAGWAPFSNGATAPTSVPGASASKCSHTPVQAPVLGTRAPASVSRALTSNGAFQPVSTHRVAASDATSNGDVQSTADRRNLRAQYRAIKMDIAEGKEVMAKLDSGSFDHMLGNVDHLYRKVTRTREQVADAEALLDISLSFLSCIKDVKHGVGVSPSELVTGVLKNFGIVAMVTDDGSNSVIDWQGLGQIATRVLADAPGMPTMLGPMDIQVKQRKIVERRARDRPVEGARPEEVQDSVEDRTETDKNMETMFGILKLRKSVRLESLVLNRTSFAQTVENIFALSFLVKDGRAKISIIDGCHIVGPMNFPSQKQREHGEGCMRQFVFRYDYRDWQAMKNALKEGDELMPNRASRTSTSSVRKVSRNRANGTVRNEVSDQDSDEDDEELQGRKRPNINS